MHDRLKKTVVMVGMMGAGKSAVGRELARRLAVPCLDSDAEIEISANASISEIFSRDGEAFFRRKEAQVIARLLAGPPCVLSVGGGAFLDVHTRARVSAEGVAIWLQVPLDLLWSRVRRKDTRPLLHTADPRGTLARLAAEREPLYAQADLRVVVQPGWSIERTAEEVHKVLAMRPDVLDRPGNVQERRDDAG